MVEITAVNYGELVGAVLVLTQILKQSEWVQKNFQSKYLALVIAEGVAVVAVITGQMPVSGLMEIANLVLGAAAVGTGAVGLHQVAKPVMPLERPKELEPAVLPTPPWAGPRKIDTTDIVRLPAGFITAFFREANSMNPSEGIWKTMETVEIPPAAYQDFRREGSSPVFALKKGHGISNPPVETKEHGVITQILEDVRALDGSRVDVFCK